MIYIIYLLTFIAIFLYLYKYFKKMINDKDLNIVAFILSVVLSLISSYMIFDIIKMHNKNMEVRK